MKKLRVAVVGVGYLGRQHVRIYRELPEEVELVGIVDKNPATGEVVAAEFNTPYYPDFEFLLGKVDAVSLAAPTAEHAGISMALLPEGIDVLVEKPIASSVEDARKMGELATEQNRILQVGHLERFNPAVVAVRKMLTRPLFFEVHRLGIFTSRSLDIDVVYDLMIHDLDLVLDFTGSPVRSVHAVGLPILSPKIDIANVRLEFENGCVANLTASRVSTEKVRKLRFFQPREYISIDFSRQDVVTVRVEPGKPTERPVTVPRRIEPPKAEPLREEIKSFLEKVRTRNPPVVTAEQGTRALELAQQIVDQIKTHVQNIQIPPLR
jgi:predicted dehydrogenase